MGKQILVCQLIRFALLCPKISPLVSCLPNYSSPKGTIFFLVLKRAADTLPNLNNRLFTESTKPNGQLALFSLANSLEHPLFISIHVLLLVSARYSKRRYKRSKKARRWRRNREKEEEGLPWSISQTGRGREDDGRAGRGLRREEAMGQKWVQKR